MDVSETPSEFRQVFNNEEPAVEIVEKIHAQREQAKRVTTDHAPTESSSDDIDRGPNPLDQIERLQELKKAGAISEEEFEDKKRDLLDQI